jgi:hypothetical protein
MRFMSWAAPRARGRLRRGGPPPPATVDEAITDGRARAREVLAAGLGQYADTIQVLDPSVDGGTVVVEVQGTLPLFFGGPGQDAPVQLPLNARARASREFFHPQGAGGY